MLLCPQLGPQGKYSKISTTAAIKESFSHTTGDVAQLDARTAQAHEAFEKNRNDRT